MRGMGLWAKLWRRPLPVGFMPMSRAFWRSWMKPTSTPSSISVVHWVGVPSSSMVREPRRSGRVPSSTTVTPLAAMRWPSSPAKALVFLRLKSPSSPWPMASWSRMPGQPGPSTTSISPAGAGTEPRLTRAWRKRLVGGGPPGLRLEIEVIAGAPADAVAAGLHAAVLVHHHADVEAHQRADVGGAMALAAQDLDRLPAAARARP